uniref:Tuftelin isoform 1 n=1 Tax=Sus scrofa TaxID=9823 RepID=A0A480MEF7_PIG
MMNGTRSWCTLVDVHPEAQTSGSVDILRLTLQSELTGDELERIAQKAGRKTYAMVSGRSTGHSLASELVESNDGHEEIIKVYLKGRSGDKMIHEKNINQLKSEVQYIQEARNSLQKLREDISSKLDKDPGASLHQQEIQVVLEKPNGFSSSPSTPPPPPNSRTPEVDTFVNEDVESLRKTVQDLLVQLQEAERQHQSERVDFEATLSRYQREAEQSHVALQRAEDRVEQKEAEVEELQKRLLGMETEHQALLAKVREGETALEELRGKNSDCRAEQEKAANLEKEVAGLREKIHHLDDMLKSQQRKVRQMIEQLQNSKTVIQSKDTAIQELKEKIAYLEAENLEMHDRMEHLIEKQISHGNFSTQNRAKTENPGRSFGSQILCAP